MINEIHIQNFRCFEDTWVSGFKNINLIGGLNNSGKTALLEALFLASFPSPKTIGNLRKFRNENDILLKLEPKKAWNSFFFNENITEDAIFTLVNSAGETAITFSCAQNDKPLAALLESRISTNDIANLLSNRFANILPLNVFGSGFNYVFFPDLEKDKEKDEISSFSLIGNEPKTYESSPFIHTSFRITDSKLAALFSMIEEDTKKINVFNSFLSFLDEKIVSCILTAPSGQAMLKILTKDGFRRSLGLFGDAIRKVVEILLLLLSGTNKIIFIDEIENGIHFTKHKEFWEKLFEISVQLDIQIFATTHSIEMIQAFAEAAKGKYENKAMYFKMGTQQLKTRKRIIASPSTADLLEDNLSPLNLTPRQPFRGE